MLPASALATPLSASQASIGKGPVAKTLASETPVRHVWPQLLMPGPARTRTERTTGGLTGLVKGVTGAPYPGVCVMATGLAGAGGAAIHLAVSHSDGRYLLAHLRPGRYRLRIANCARAAGDGSNPAIAWPTLAGSPRASTGKASTGKVGSISGRVTVRSATITKVDAALRR